MEIDFLYKKDGAVGFYYFCVDERHPWYEDKIFDLKLRMYFWLYSLGYGKIVPKYFMKKLYTYVPLPEDIGK